MAHHTHPGTGSHRDTAQTRRVSTGAPAEQPRHCLCCQRPDAAPGREFCIACTGHLAPQPAAGYRAPANRTWTAQHAEPCPYADTDSPHKCARETPAPHRATHTPPAAAPRRRPAAPDTGTPDIAITGSLCRICRAPMVTVRSTRVGRIPGGHVIHHARGVCRICAGAALPPRPSRAIHSGHRHPTGRPSNADTIDRERVAAAVAGAPVILNAAERLAAILQMHADGRSARQTAQTLGLASRTVERWLKTSGAWA